MSDNFASQEMRRRLIIFLRIPNETWTDVLKMLPRRILFQKIAPVCYRLKEIGDKNVKSIHLIENADEFNKKLAENDPEAIRQVEHLAGNKCKLAEYFQLTKLRISDEKVKAVLHHSLDLLRGCKITFDGAYHQTNFAYYDRCLSILGSFRPIVIRFGRRLNSVNHYWIHPTVRSCNRIVIGYESTAVKFVFEWLHHKPMNLADSAVDHVRCMIGSRIGIWTNNEIEWLLNRCIENLKQSRTSAHRRQFVLSFVVWVGAADQLENKRLKNRMTGEVLVFRRVREAEDDTTDITTTFRCRRCLADEEAGDAAEEFYAKVFKPNNGGDQFNLEEVKAEVLIDK